MKSLLVFNFKRKNTLKSFLTNFNKYKYKLMIALMPYFGLTKFDLNSINRLPKATFFNAFIIFQALQYQ